VLDVEPRGLSDLISSKKAYCAVGLREGRMGKGKGGNEECREVITIISMKQQHTQGYVYPPRCEGKFNGGMTIS
jgi:hypothetical protein